VSIAMICPNVEGYLHWIKKPFPEPLNSWPQWTRIVDAWVVYGSILKDEDIAELALCDDIVIIIANPIRSKYIKKIILDIKERLPRKKIVLFIDGHQETMFDRIRAWDFYWCLNNVDLIATNRKYTTYIQLLTNVKTYWLSFPVDISYFAGFRTNKNVGTVAVCAASGALEAITILHRFNSNLKFKLTERGGFFTREQLDYLGMLDFVDVQPKVNQQLFYERISDCEVGVYLDYKGHLGRFQTDCAVLGIPCIGMTCTDRQKMLFPRIMVGNYNEIYNVISSYAILVHNKKFYKEVTDYARNKVLEFSTVKSIVRWNKMIEMLS